MIGVGVLGIALKIKKSLGTFYKFTQGLSPFAFFLPHPSGKNPKPKPSAPVCWDVTDCKDIFS